MMWLYKTTLFRHTHLKGRDVMSIVDRLQLWKLKRNVEIFQHKYLFDSILAFSGTMFITACIYIWHLYPRIPNISIIYLLVVIVLASTRGRYSAIFASIVASLSFDFFIVPPLYKLTMYRPEEWIALLVFLVDAMLTGQLAAALRTRARASLRREYEARALYDLVSMASKEEEPEHQLQVIAQAIVKVFALWGVQDCAILRPDSSGQLHVQASAYQSPEQVTLTTEEQAMADWVIKHKRPMSVYDDAVLAPAARSHVMQRITLPYLTRGRAAIRSLRLLPLRVGQQVIGVLRLRVSTDPHHMVGEEDLEDHLAQTETHTTFFWTFLEQATALIERAELRRENMRIEILQRTDALRAALLSSVSHDLRTPLTAIKAAATSLLQEEVHWSNEARRGFALSIVRQADRLNRLVGNLLDMSRIEEGALRPEKEWYHLAELIYDVLDRLRPLLQDRVVRTQIADDLPPVELDYLHMDQVLTNLLENAVRYTPPDSPIEIRVGQDDQQIVLSVADHGPGIPPADLERIFDKFYRVLGDCDAAARAAGVPAGSGLGLAVCRGLVEAQGGRIWAEARPGGGAIFYVALPKSAPERIPV
jgi:two-component system sensor histidine kinase KdpD